MSVGCRRGQGSIIGAAFLILILFTGYAFIQLNLRSQIEYQDILSEVRKLELEGLQEVIEFRRVRTDASDGLWLTLRNNGPNTAHIILIGIFDQTVTPETQTYYDVSVYMKPSETISYQSPLITLPSGGKYVVQLVTEVGNIFSTSFTPGTEVSAKTTISIIPGPSINYPSSCSIEQGTPKSGTVPQSVQDVDGDYFKVDSDNKRVTTVFFFTGLVSDSPQSLWLKIVLKHNKDGTNVVIQAYNYASMDYASSGQGFISYTASGSDETKWLNITSGASNFVSGGKAKIRIDSTYSQNFNQWTDQMKLDYSYTTSELAYDTLRKYTIMVSDDVSGNARPYASLVIFSNGTHVSFEGLSNPAYVNADEYGTFDLNLRSSTVGGETFRLYVLVGSVAAEKDIEQRP